MPEAKKTQPKSENSKNLVPLVIKIISTLQLLVYFWTLYLTYATNHDVNGAEIDGLYAIFPAALFVFFGAVNAIFVIAYSISLIRKKAKLDKVAVGFVALILLLTLFAMPISNFVDSL